MREIWKPVPGMPREIEASSIGRIRYAKVLRTNGQMSDFPGKPMNGSVYLNGINKKHRRIKITLRTSYGAPRRLKTYRLGRLVCAAFHGPPPFLDAKCLHVDENGLNNCPENLKWGTQKENLNAPGFLA